MGGACFGVAREEGLWEMKGGVEKSPRRGCDWGMKEGLPVGAEPTGLGSKGAELGVRRCLQGGWWEGGQ